MSQPDSNTRELTRHDLYELCVQHERWDYETIYGHAGSILVKAAREYNYDVSRSMRMARRQLYAYVT